jgi:hypothetical protein
MGESTVIIRPIEVTDAENYLELSKKIDELICVNEYYLYKLL